MAQYITFSENNTEYGREFVDAIIAQIMWQFSVTNMSKESSNHSLCVIFVNSMAFFFFASFIFGFGCVTLMVVF